MSTSESSTTSGEVVLGGPSEIDQFLDMKCSDCRRYLWIPPIYSLKYGTTSRCSACYLRNPADYDYYYENTLYEKLAFNLRFPCQRSRECPGRIMMGNHSLHDNNCEYTAIPCPYPQCDVVIELDDIYPHFKALHTAYDDNPLCFLISGNVSNIVAFRSRADTFLIWYVVENGTLWLDVFSMTSRIDPGMFGYNISTDRTLTTLYTWKCSRFQAQNLDKSKMQLNVTVSSVLGTNEPPENFTLTVIVRARYTQNVLFRCVVCGKTIEVNIRKCGTNYVCLACHENQTVCPHCGNFFEDQRIYSSNVLAYLMNADYKRINSRYRQISDVQCSADSMYPTQRVLLNYS